MTVEELEAQERRHDLIRLQRGAQEKAHEDGRLEGHEAGRQAGEIKARRVVARNLLPVLDDAAIAAATGLPQETVARLRKERCGNAA